MAHARHEAEPNLRSRRGARVLAIVAVLAIISALAGAGTSGLAGPAPGVGASVTVLGDVTGRLASGPPRVRLVAPPRPVAEPTPSPPSAPAPPVVSPPPLLPVAAPEPVAASVEVALGPAAADLVTRINGLRASVGVPPLTVDGELTERAVRWARTMGAGGDIWHQADLSVGLAADWFRLGENVGYGPGVGPIHDAFIVSPTHYANLVDPGFQSVGVGVVEIGGRSYVAEEFMQRERASSAPAFASAVRSVR